MDNQRDNLYYLPRDTSRQLTAERLKGCKNLGLLLDKYPQRIAIEKSEGKSRWLKETTADNHVDPRLAENLYLRWLDMTKAMGAIHFYAAIDWRMIVGLGGQTVLETDITLHHLYGTPYIPGSALKGLTRSYVTSEVEGYKSDSIENDNEEIKRIFGSQEHAGTVIFFDAIPEGGKTSFSLDIMNPHYPDYYGGDKAPSNDQSPVPITFLTVTDTVFTFALAPRSPSYAGDLAKAKKWLQEAVEKYGVGAKTSAGYGYLKLQDKPVSSPTLQQAVSTSSSMRPNLPKFREGQEIRGTVVALPDELRQKVPAGTTAILRYESFPLKDILIAVNAEEAQNWKSGETRFCLFIREEVIDGTTILICRPRPKKRG